MYRIEITKYRPRRSDRQNRRYWPAIVKPFTQWMNDEQGYALSEDQCHDILKIQFLTTTYTDPTTGEVRDVPRSTTKLNTEEFNRYTSDCENLLAEYCGIVIPEEVKA